jgi:putative membrane protein
MGVRGGHALGAPTSAQVARAHAAALKDLRTKRGAEFDRAFLRHEATFHRDVIQAVQATLLPAIQNDELRALVEKVAPAFRAHMLAAEQLSRELGYSQASAGSAGAGTN